MPSRLNLLHRSPLSTLLLCVSLACASIALLPMAPGSPGPASDPIGGRCSQPGWVSELAPAAVPAPPAKMLLAAADRPSAAEFRRIFGFFGRGRVEEPAGRLVRKPKCGGYAVGPSAHQFAVGAYVGRISNAWIPEPDFKPEGNQTMAQLARLMARVHARLLDPDRKEVVLQSFYVHEGDQICSGDVLETWHGVHVQVDYEPSAPGSATGGEASSSIQRTVELSGGSMVRFHPHMVDQAAGTMSYLSEGGNYTVSNADRIRLLVANGALEVSGIQSKVRSKVEDACSGQALIAVLDEGDETEHGVLVRARRPGTEEAFGPPALIDEGVALRVRPGEAAQGMPVEVAAEALDTGAPTTSGGALMAELQRDAREAREMQEAAQQQPPTSRHPKAVPVAFTLKVKVRSQKRPEVLEVNGEHLSVGTGHDYDALSWFPLDEAGGMPYWSAEARQRALPGPILIAVQRGEQPALTEVKHVKAEGGLMEVVFAGEDGTAIRPPPPDLLTWVRIPGGTFRMGHGYVFGGEERFRWIIKLMTDGSADLSDLFSDESPVHKVTVPTFYLTRTEVTVAQFRACVEAGACFDQSKLDRWSWCNFSQPDRDDYPVNCVSWYTAREFAAWVGGRLPSEAEWEYAARGTEGREYPWGNGPDPCQVAIKSRDCEEGSNWPVCFRKEDRTPGTDLCDMGGNAAEWVADCYHDSYKNAPNQGQVWNEDCENYDGRLVGRRYGVARGGGRVTDPYMHRGAKREWKGFGDRDGAMGFRVAASHAPQ